MFDDDDSGYIVSRVSGSGIEVITSDDRLADGGKIRNVRGTGYSLGAFDSQAGCNAVDRIRIDEVQLRRPELATDI